MQAFRAIVISAALLCACADRAGAQMIRISGTVKDEAGRPVRGAVITAENPEQAPPRLSTTSNDKGQFGFIGIRRGTWTFSIEAPGYETVRFPRQLAPGPRPEAIDLRLVRTSTPVALPLDGLKATEIQQRIDRAESLASGGDLDAAIAAWRDLLARVPALTSIHLRVGELYERKADPDRALAAYRQLLELEPGNERAKRAVEKLTKKV